MTRTKPRVLVVIAIACVFLLSAVAVGHAKTKLVPKVDSFIIMQDYSGSMAMKHQEQGEEKIVLAKKFLQKFNAAVPEMEYESRFYTFAPFEWKVGGEYDREVMGRTIDGLSTGYEVFGRLTPMGNDFAKLNMPLQNMEKDIAVIIVGDGLNNLGHDPVEEVRNLYAAYPGHVCFHVVSFADTAEGQQTLDAIAGLSPCSVSASGLELLESDMALETFVKNVFFDEVMVEEKAEAMPMVEDVIPLRVNFDFDSSKIKDVMIPILDEAAGIVKDKPESKVRLEGHTCNIGTEEYNMGLSERRAWSVYKYLEKHGVDKDRMSVKGMGESHPKYDNTTREGRKLNRRVQIIFE